MTDTGQEGATTGQGGPANGKTPGSIAAPFSGKQGRKKEWVGLAKSAVVGRCFWPAAATVVKRQTAAAGQRQQQQQQQQQRALLREETNGLLTDIGSGS